MAIGLMTIPLDRFAGLVHRRRGVGELLTKPVDVIHGGLEVNVEPLTSGKASVAILTPDRQTIDGYGHDDCQIGDLDRHQISHPCPLARKRRPGCVAWPAGPSPGTHRWRSVLRISVCRYCVTAQRAPVHRSWMACWVGAHSSTVLPATLIDPRMTIFLSTEDCSMRAWPTPHLDHSAPTPSSTSRVDRGHGRFEYPLAPLAA